MMPQQRRSGKGDKTEEREEGERERGEREGEREGGGGRATQGVCEQQLCILSHCHKQAVALLTR